MMYIHEKYFLGRRGSAVLETRERVKYDVILSGYTGLGGHNSTFVIKDLLASFTFTVRNPSIWVWLLAVILPILSSF